MKELEFQKNRHSCESRNLFHNWQDLGFREDDDVVGFDSIHEVLKTKCYSFTLYS